MTLKRKESQERKDITRYTAHTIVYDRTLNKG